MDNEILGYASLFKLLLVYTI